jgi:hypothetical protein
MKLKTLGLGLVALTLLGTLTFAAADGTRAPKPGADGQGQRHERVQGRHRLEKLRGFLRSLQFNASQRAAALQAARAVQPVAEQARAEARSIVQAARQANPTGDRATIRAAVQGQLKALRERTQQQIEPNGRALAATLTPEQRAKLAERAEKHGRTFDENKLARRMSFLLSRPRAVQFLERHQEQGPKTGK